jgi:D-alanyl-D-alanine dipeptidase
MIVISHDAKTEDPTAVDLGEQLDEFDNLAPAAFVVQGILADDSRDSTAQMIERAAVFGLHSRQSRHGFPPLDQEWVHHSAIEQTRQHTSQCPLYPSGSP